MKFSPVQLPGPPNSIDPDSWHSDDQLYSIRRYYCRTKQYVHIPVDPYFVGYQRWDGKRITDELPTLAACIQAVIAQTPRTSP